MHLYLNWFNEFKEDGYYCKKYVSLQIRGHSTCILVVRRYKLWLRPILYLVVKKISSEY